MKYFLIAILSFTYCNAQYRFANTYDISLSRFGELSTSVLETNDDYIVLGWGMYNYNNQVLLPQNEIIAINKNNFNNYQVSKIEPYPDSTNSFASEKIKKYKNGYLVTAFTWDTIDQGINRGNIRLTFTDNSFNVIRHKIIDNGLDDFVKTFEILPNNDIIIVGQTNSFGDLDYYQGYLARLDSLGNIIWQTTFGQIGYEDIPYSLQIINNSIYITGFIRNYQLQYMRTMAYKYDINGNFIAYKNYADNYLNYSVSAIYDGGNIILTGGTDTNDGTNTQSKYMLKIDTMLNKIWSKTFPNTTNSIEPFNFTSIFDEDKNQLLVTGGNNAFGNPIAGLYAIDTTGNIRWQQEYYTRPDISQYLYDIQKTSDGGYIMCGSAFPNTPNPTQDFWVIKTDSVGCVVHCITGVDDISPPLEGLGEVKLYPNPAHDFVNIEISPPQEGLGVGTNRNLTLYNTEGKAVPANIRWHHAANVSSSQQETHEPKANALGDVWEQSSRGEVNIQHLPRGLYFVKIGNHTATFVKE